MFYPKYKYQQGGQTPPYSPEQDPSYNHMNRLAGKDAVQPQNQAQTQQPTMEELQKMFAALPQEVQQQIVKLPKEQQVQAVVTAYQELMNNPEAQQQMQQGQQEQTEAPTSMPTPTMQKGGKVNEELVNDYFEKLPRDYKKALRREMLYVSPEKLAQWKMDKINEYSEMIKQNQKANEMQAQAPKQNPIANLQPTQQNMQEETQEMETGEDNAEEELRESDMVEFKYGGKIYRAKVCK